MFDLNVVGWTDDVEPFASQQFGGHDMLGIADRLVFGPDAVMIGDQGAATPDPDPAQDLR